MANGIEPGAEFRLMSRAKKVDVSGPWTTDQLSASGQVFEFRLWALLTEQSRGQLHIFLPLTDRGIDGLIHRRTDDAYISVQAKCRSQLHDGEVQIAVWADSLRDDNALLVSGLITEGGLGPTLLVVPEGEFKRLAYLTSNSGKPVYAAEFGMNPRSDSKWLPWLASAERIGERFGVLRPSEELVELRRPEWRSDVGFLGEAETARLLATSGDLNLFRPFPDNETAELAVLHQESRRVVGLQIKTVDVTQARMHAAVHIYAPSFRPSPTTYVVVLAWHRGEGRFVDDCLLIPSGDIHTLARPPDRRGHLNFEWRLGAPLTSKLLPYTTLLEKLNATVARLLSDARLA